MLVRCMWDAALRAEQRTMFSTSAQIAFEESEGRGGGGIRQRRVGEAVLGATLRLCHREGRHCRVRTAAAVVSSASPALV